MLLIFHLVFDAMETLLISNSILWHTIACLTVASFSVLQVTGHHKIISCFLSFFGNFMQFRKGSLVQSILSQNGSFDSKLILLQNASYGYAYKVLHFGFWNWFCSKMEFCLVSNHVLNFLIYTGSTNDSVVCLYFVDDTSQTTLLVIITFIHLHTILVHRIAALFWWVGLTFKSIIKGNVGHIEVPSSSSANYVLLILCVFLFL
jgi:hypothetical protein